MTNPPRKWFGARGEKFPIQKGTLAICYNCARPFAKVIKEITEEDTPETGIHKLRYLNGRKIKESHPYFIHPKCEGKYERK